MFGEELLTIVSTIYAPPARRRLEFCIGPVSSRAIEPTENPTMSLILTDTQKVVLSIAPKSAAGNPAKVDGVPAWSATGDQLTLTPAADGMSCVVTTSGTLGTAQVSVTADADLGEGVKPIAGTLDIEVVAGEAVSLGISHAEPEPRLPA